MRLQRRAIALLTLCYALGAIPALAQTGTRGNISGVISDVNGRPIGSAVVSVVSSITSITTDDRGRYGIVGLGLGMQLLRVKAIGYQQRIVQVDVSPDETVDGSVEMRLGAQMLDTVHVVARGFYDKPARLDYTMRYDPFFEHRRTGMGKYFTHEQIVAMPGLTRARDIANRFPFFRAVGNGARKCASPWIYLNGMKQRGDEILDWLESTEIEAMEYHHGISDSPVGEDACSLWIWTN